MTKLTLLPLLFIFIAGIGYTDEIDEIIPFIIKVESSGNPNAISKDGCIGLMQISAIMLEEWRKEYIGLIFSDNPFAAEAGRESWDRNIGSLYNAEFNIQIGTWYLRRLKDHYLKDVKILDHPFRFKEIRVIVNEERFAYKHTKYIECANDYRIALILACYNAGPTRMRKLNWDISKAPKETRYYIRKVLRLYKSKEER